MNQNLITAIGIWGADWATGFTGSESGLA